MSRQDWLGWLTIGLVIAAILLVPVAILIVLWVGPRW